MMFRVSVLAAVTIVLGCAPDADLPTDQDIALLRSSLPGINERCVDAFKKGGIQAIPQDVRECFPMEPSKRWTGLLRDEFEGSRFCVAPSDQCTSNAGGERVWLTFAEEIEDERPGRYSTDNLYEIEFIGRKTEKPGAFGHEGAFENEIVVEKLIRLDLASGS